MPKTSYQYGTSPRKYEPDYTARKTTTVKTTSKKKQVNKIDKKSDAKKRIEEKRTKKIQERKNKTLQVIVVIAVFGMLLTLSYREIALMEMFNQKKNLETQLASIQKENGQVEKSIKEEESKLNWSEIKQKASEQLNMQIKNAKPVNLAKQDNIETKYEFIKEEETNILEEIIKFFIIK